MSTIRIPRQLAEAVDGDERVHPTRPRWLDGLPRVVETLAFDWGLELGEPFEPGGRTGWTAPARRSDCGQLVLKAGWLHPEGRRAADALRLWDGDGAVRCLAARTIDDTSALLLERCEPGTQLSSMVAEPQRDVVLAGLMGRLWSHRPADESRFDSLAAMCNRWAEEFEELARDDGGLDPGLARDALATLRELPRTAHASVLLCTDLHAGNVLAAKREPWLVIVPKPHVGDPAYDSVQHMLNCDRLAIDPVGLAGRMAQLLDLDRERVRLWLYARCAQESLRHLRMRGPARMLAP